MGFLATLAIYAALMVVAYYTKPKTPKGRADRRTQDDAPTVREGVTIPLWYGMCRFDAPNLVWNSKRVRVPGTGVTRGEEIYGANMMFVLGIPGGKQPSVADSAHSVYFKSLTVNEMQTAGVTSNIVQFSNQVDGWLDDSTPISFNQGIISFRFDDQVNGIRGRVVFSAGFHDTLQFGAGEFAADTSLSPTLWPAYRFQTTMLCVGFEGPAKPSAVRNDRFKRDHYFGWGISPDLPSIVPVLTNPCVVDMGGGYPEILMADGFNPNPVSVLYDILTNDWARVGLPDSVIDKGSFAAAASVLAAENHGWGGFLTDPDEAADVIRDIMAQVNGVLYQDPQSGLLKLKLVRYDYTVGALPLFDESNVVEVMQFMTSTTEENYNQVRVTYTDAGRGFAIKTAVAQDIANITAQGNRVRAVTVDFPHIRESGLAARVAARELNEVSLPLAALKIRVNRDAFTHRPGDAFRFRWNDLNMVDVVFRVQHIDLGQPGDESIVVDSVQDAFAFDYATIGVPEVGVADAPILPIQERVFTEAPRYFNVQAQVSGFISDPNQGHLWYLPTPAQDESGGFGVYEYDDNNDRVVADMAPFEPVAYPARALVNTSYSRTLDPYDTSTGLQIKSLSDSSVLKTATVTEIRTRGKNLIIVGREVMAYETFTDLGSGVFRLNNVWRGLLDSPTIAHVADERVYFLSDGIGATGQVYVGRKAHQYAGDTANARFLANVGGIMQSPSEYGVETDRLVALNRQLLPYPPSDMHVNLAKSVSSLSEEGTHVDWKPRNRLTTLVIRGNDASETVNDVQYRVKMQKVGPLSITGSATQVDVQAAGVEDSFCTSTTAGHGEIDAVVASFDTVESVECWEPVRVTMTCPPWRNLLANPSFDDALTTWTPAWIAVTGGDLGSDSGHVHGDSPFYLTADGLNEEIDVSQTVDITGYHAERMTANVTWFAKQIASSTDTMTVTLSALDSSSSSLTSTTLGPSTPTTQWVRYSLTITNLPADTAKIKVRVQGDHEEDAITTIAFADFTLRVGQMSSQLLSNGDFQSGGGSLTSWTTVSGSWATVTTAGYDGNVVATNNSSGTSELRQDVTMPAGFDYGTAVVSWAQRDADTADGDTGQVILEALDGGSSVVATASSTALEATPLGFFVPRQLELDNLPPTTATIRVRAIAVADTTNDVMFDAFSLRVHKHLDPDQRLDADFRVPTTQRRPLDRGDWVEAFPTVPMPDYGMFTYGNFIGGAMHGRLGIEPVLDAPSGARTGKFVGLYVAEDDTISGNVAELQSTDDGLISTDRKLYGNFSSDESFSVLCIFRNRLPAASGSGLVGRFDAFVDNVGWSLEITGSGFVQARLEGDLGTATATRATAVKDGHPWMAWLIYDAGSLELHCVDPSGVTTVSTVGIGEIKTSSDAQFMIGKCESSQTCLDGQIDVHLWRQAITTTQAQSIWDHGKSPTAAVQLSGRTGTVVLPVGFDADGELLGSCHQTQLPIGRVSGTSSSIGVAMNVAMTSLVTSWNFRDTTAWPRDGGATVTVDQPSPLGFLDGMAISGTNAAGVRSADFTLSASTTVKVTWWARTAESTHNARLELQNSSGVVKGTIDFALGPTWTRYDHTFTTWDASTASGRVKFYGSDTGSAQQVEIASSGYVSQSTFVPICVPCSDPVDPGLLQFSATGMTRFNQEGEIYVQTHGKMSSPGVQRDIIDVTNGGDDNDSRIIRYNSSSNAQLVHFDGSGSSNTATASGTGWDTLRTLRGRWNRAGLIEAAATFSAINRDGVSTTGRSAIWTASSTTVQTMRLLASDLLIPRVILFSREVNLDQSV